MNNQKDFWLTDEAWMVTDMGIAHDMAIIEWYFRDLHREDPVNYPEDAITYWQRLSSAYWIESAKKIFMKRIRKIFDESK